MDWNKYLEPIEYHEFICVLLVLTMLKQLIYLDFIQNAFFHGIFYQLLALTLGVPFLYDD